MLQAGKRLSWALGIAGLAAAIAGPGHAGAAEFGPPQHITGVFFSNFENARLFVCDDGSTPCARWADGQDYSLRCKGAVCDPLSKALRVAAAKTEDQTAYVRVRLVGRRSLKQAKPRFIGDPGREILVERIESAVAIRGD